jgi:rhodanese-related sulfurtransferase
VHVPLGQLGTAAAAEALTALDPAADTIVYCAGGMRSLKALVPLRERHGFTAVRSLRGGFKAWSE